MASKTYEAAAMHRISRKVWEALGGVNNPRLHVRSAKRGPDRYYLIEAIVKGGEK